MNEKYSFIQKEKLVKSLILLKKIQI